MTNPKPPSKFPFIVTTKYEADLLLVTNYRVIASSPSEAEEKYLSSGIIINENRDDYNGYTTVTKVIEDDSDSFHSLSCPDCGSSLLRCYISHEKLFVSCDCGLFTESANLVVEESG